MIEIFRTGVPMTSGLRHPPNWSYIQRNFKANIDKVKKYYRQFPAAVRSEHFLVRLILTMPTPIGISLPAYYSQTDKIALQHARLHQLTSEVSFGKVHTGGFFGHLNPEIYLATDDHFDPQFVVDNWQEAIPIKVLKHCSDSFQMALPQPNNYSYTKDMLSVSLINLPMLMVQYYGFCEEQKTKPLEERLNITQFIGGWVLPNMIESILDVALMNRLSKLSGIKQIPQPYVRPAHPFMLVNYDAGIDVALEMTLDNIQHISMQFDNILKCIPSFTKRHLYESLMMPDIAPTRQVDWALTAARIEYTHWLFSICKTELLKKNQRVVNHVFMSLRRNDVLSIMENAVPTEAFTLISSNILDMLELTKRNYI